MAQRRGDKDEKFCNVTDDRVTYYYNKDADPRMRQMEAFRQEHLTRGALCNRVDIRHVEFRPPSIAESTASSSTAGGYIPVMLVDNPTTPAPRIMAVARSMVEGNDQTSTVGSISWHGQGRHSDMYLGVPGPASVEVGGLRSTFEWGTDDEERAAAAAEEGGSDGHGGDDGGDDGVEEVTEITEIMDANPPSVFESWGTGECGEEVPLVGNSSPDGSKDQNDEDSHDAGDDDDDETNAGDAEISNKRDSPANNLAAEDSLDDDVVSRAEEAVKGTDDDFHPFQGIIADSDHRDEELSESDAPHELEEDYMLPGGVPSTEAEAEAEAYGAAETSKSKAKGKEKEIPSDTAPEGTECQGFTEKRPEESEAESPIQVVYVYAPSAPAKPKRIRRRAKPPRPEGVRSRSRKATTVTGSSAQPRRRVKKKRACEPIEHVSPTASQAAPTNETTLVQEKPIQPEGYYSPLVTDELTELMLPPPMLSSDIVPVIQMAYRRLNVPLQPLHLQDTGIPASQASPTQMKDISTSSVPPPPPTPPTPLPPGPQPTSQLRPVPARRATVAGLNTGTGLGVSSVYGPLSTLLSDKYIPFSPMYSRTPILIATEEEEAVRSAMGFRPHSTIGRLILSASGSLRAGVAMKDRTRSLGVPRARSGAAGESRQRSAAAARESEESPAVERGE